jgi:type IV pilus assembly protein PilW
MNSIRLRKRAPLQTIGGEAGFTLVEIMVGLVLSLIIMFALSVLFVNNSRTRTQIDDSTQQIENGRYALDVLRDDLHLAGFYGEIVPQQGYVTASATTPSLWAAGRPSPRAAS